MSVQQPEQVSKAFVAAFNACDVDALVSLYEPNATYVHGDRKIEGSAGIREILAQHTAAKPQMELTNEYCIVSNDIALVRARWKLHWRDATTKQLHIKQGHSSEVLRRGSDGFWRYILDHPTGGD